MLVYRATLKAVKALVLSAGGMFGAYQVGAWEVLSEYFTPDLVVGASVGSLNGWAIAGGCKPQELARYWQELDTSKVRLRFPLSPLQGFVDTRGMDAVAREFHAAFTPKIPYALVLTELLRLRPVIFDRNITYRHLVASCAIVGVFDQVRLNGTIYTDGGLLAALPAWAAAQLGATEVLAIHVLPRLPSATVRWLNRGLCRISRFRPTVPANVKVVKLAPDGALGSARDMLAWDRQKVDRWIEQGRREAEAIKHCLPEMFRAQ